MKRTLKFALLLAIAAVASPQNANAQLGNVLKKAKKAVETVTGKPADQTVSDLTTKKVAIEGGGIIQNPLASSVEIVPVGLFGESVSENFGSVYLVLRVKMLLNKNCIGFGGEHNALKTLAVDGSGNAYKPDGFGQTYKDVTEGIAVRLKLNDRALLFTDVKKSQTVMQQIKLVVFIDQQHSGIVTLKDVPIQWDVNPDDVQ